jgi:tetratricopeptide (TPR) repeat protein
MKFSLTAFGGVSAFLFATAPLHANPLPLEVAQTQNDLTYWYDICVKSSGQEAVDGCDRVLEITPDDETTWTNRGNALDDLGRGEEALGSHDRALELSPGYSLALANRCATLGNLGRHQAAIESCLAAIEGDERWGEGGAELAWDNMGVSLAYLVDVLPRLKAGGFIVLRVSVS